MRPKIISVGESVVEIMRPGVGQPLDSSGEFRGPFASGAPAIFAVAAARLGMPTGLVSGVGQDAFGRLQRRYLSAEDVDISQMQQLEAHTTGIAFVAYDQEGEREFVFHLRQSAAAAVDAAALDPGYFEAVEWLHISGSALALGPQSVAMCQRALELTRQRDGRFSFDPNLRPELMPLDQAREVFAPFLAQADLLLPTVAEAYALAGTDDDEAAARFLLQEEERLVVLKRGDVGSTVFTQDGRIEANGFFVEEVDPTGAGDCFSAAFVYGLRAGWKLERTARFANAAGALSVLVQGPMAGAPFVDEIEALL